MSAQCGWYIFSVVVALNDRNQIHHLKIVNGNKHYDNFGVMGPLSDDDVKDFGGPAYSQKARKADNNMMDWYYDYGEYDGV